MPNAAIRQIIADKLGEVNFLGLPEFATGLLGCLGYKSDRRLDLPGDIDSFIREFPAPNPGTITEQALRENAKTCALVFQLTDSEIDSFASRQGLLMDVVTPFDSGNAKSFIFTAIELNQSEYSRGKYAELTREINKRFSVPTVVIFKTSSNLLTIGFMNRRPDKRKNNREVLGNVSLIRHIDAAKPHTAHLDILADLALTNLLDWIDDNRKPSTFDGLLAAWLAKLDAQELNKRFYRELFAWFERAVKVATFPSNQPDPVTPETHAVRLITRLLFVWFIKEKGLVADDLFNEQQVSALLKEYDRDGGDSYYRAILQNLFFATLNTEIDLRRFSTRHRNDHRNFSVYRYQDEISDANKLSNLFTQTPFINGGLFDCLDDFLSTRAGGYRIDCFSDNKSYRHLLSIPNLLFFGQEGLITLFNRYKFTVEENTPVEQEVALDPELLGSVFENLLAAINPETKETARKMTGSYYTPRPVVDYMVDEALVASLTQTVKPSIGDRNFLEERIRYLLDYHDAYDDGGTLFKLEEKSRLVEAIANIKILDPAVGSGAFPMGVLQKLTLALRRIDRKNNKWEELQKELAGNRARAAFGILDQRERGIELQEISDTFERYRESDFGRKLYLIQNSIYGVDIQPYACQIAKLRFFISLAIEQTPNFRKADNYGIKPLPNLETRFVSADTLLGLEAQLGLGQTHEVMKLQRQIGDNRERYFHTNTRQLKLECVTKDEKLRNDLAAELLKIGMPAKDARKIAEWDPYDQNANANWFDPEYMFGVTEGYDIVIGNPSVYSIAEKQRRIGTSL